MSVTVFALVTIRENEPQALATYLQATVPLLESVGARITRRFRVNEAIVGDRPSQTMIMVDYPDRRAVDAVFSSPAYQDIIPIRDQAFSTYQVSIVTNEEEGPSEEAMPH